MSDPRPITTDAGNDAGDRAQEAERLRDLRDEYWSELPPPVCPWCGRRMSACQCDPGEAPF